MNRARMMRTGGAWGLSLLTVVALFAVPARGAGADSSAARTAEQAAEAKIRESVVKISATMRPPEILRPWTKQSPRDASGTGVVIEGKRILTNAHVVLYASQLFVESEESSDKLTATVEAISPGMDLAVLKLDDESFFNKRPPLPRTQELPDVKETVLTYGYPQGGSSLSITKGIVSRIEFTGYGEGASGVRIQVDAAINPGNSGGPALVNNKIIGLIFSKLTQADNIGYIIPSEEIDLFLADVKDGKYDGKPALHEPLQTFENDALRGFLNLDKKAQGMIVHKVVSKDPKYPLKAWDLITKIGDHAIDNTGLVKVKNDLRLRFQYYIQKLAKDGKIKLTIVREGKTLEVEVPVSNKDPKLIESLQGEYPSYFVYGPLVFSKATNEFTSAFDRAGGRIQTLLAAMGSPLVTRRGDAPAFAGEELVVVTSPMFPHILAKGYDNPFSKVVKAINGEKVKSLRHMIELLRDTKAKYVQISFDDRFSETIVFNHQQALKATEEILSDNGIRQQASDDLLSVWTKKK